MPQQTHSEPDYSLLRQELYDVPKSVTAFFDNELACLLQCGIRNPHLSLHLLGEALLRAWLYAEHPTGQQMLAMANPYLSPDLIIKSKERIIDQAQTIKRGNVDMRTLDPATIGLVGQDARIWSFLLERMQDYCRADGLIPVINPASPANGLLLPFKVFPGADQPGEILDKSEQAIGNWGPRIKAVQHLFDYQPRIVLSCHCGKRADLLKGNSMILPICIAMARRAGSLGDFSMWDVVATGALGPDGILKEVGGLTGKREAIRRIGARLFIHPAAADSISQSTDTLPIASNTPLADCFTHIDNAITDRSLAKLDSQQILGKLKDLKSEIHDGLISLEKAAPRLDRYDAMLKQMDTPDDYTTEGLAVALIIRGSIANHAGDPAKAGVSLTQALELIDAHGLDPLLYCNSVANTVVSLTDLGLLDEAEREGRKLLETVQTMRADTNTKDQARMTANGVLGGQPLLQKALLSAELAKESLDLLTVAYDCAVRLKDPKEQARDAVQIALWHALIKPESAAAEIAIAEQRLEALHTHGESSLPFLLNYHFLAAYRLLLLQNRTTPGFQSWPLPETGPDWVRAVALKYRGTLHARAGNIQQAEQDFQQAFTNLDATNMPLLRFIAATTALQAAQSLSKSQTDISQKYAALALERFKALEPILHGIHRAPAWQQAARALIELHHPVESPQKYYRY